MSGTLIALVGPSGAGKDSLIAAARRHFGDNPAIGFVRRVITRPHDIHEDHEPVTAEQFARMEAEGAFALSWRANGLGYGLRATISCDLERGRVLVANLSREAVPALRARVARPLVVHVTASAQVLGDRLARRSRESPQEQKARLARALALDRTVDADVRIENNGALELAQYRLIDLLEAFVGAAPRIGAEP
jgi:ribose 1,5-bisphosphokinase